MPNTKISYRYRDASNCKVYCEVVVKGVFESQILMDALHEGEFFIPHDLSLPELQNKPWNEDDHIWHELIEVEETDEAPNAEVTSDMLLSKMPEIEARGWDEKSAFLRWGLLP